MGDFDAFEREAWSGRAAAYARSFGMLCAHTVPELLDAAGVGAGVRVLDVGTGPGAAAAEAVRRGAEVAAVDAEPSMVERAARAVPAAEVRLGVLPGLPYEDGEFDAVVANFVVNHVGRPAAALADLRRLAGPGGRVAVTIWPAPRSPGQALLGRALEAAGVSRPPSIPALAAEDDFARTEEGLAGLLTAAGLAGARCATLRWNHVVDPEVWWSGPAAGVASIGQILQSLPPHDVEEVRRHYDLLSAEFRTPDGSLSLPHTALLGWALAG
ncbi:Methyltransferase domain-containing protein [Actinacidiphila yanglinensis]|uniref:Methyltransferase domain-containing protein n=1 Tax=Actinacidiphila yanglinensis TaxID=310779 RepID=A0A1H6BW83_9ACTN|nr:class I SAM-dependent methyltransferase [Actinacidiphila yanglinensis]SEG64940.1 Methyltransferase domain-containing protein [Actinacidiphila yanglinensis]